MTTHSLAVALAIVIAEDAADIWTSPAVIAVSVQVCAVPRAVSIASLSPYDPPLIAKLTVSVALPVANVQ